jgi:hypothetical protein
LPESLRAPALAPPRDPVLALPPREGRALLRLVGVFGAIAWSPVLGVAREDKTGDCGAARRLVVAVVLVTAAGRCRDACGARKFAVADGRVDDRASLHSGAVLRETAAVQRYGCDSEGGVWERMRRGTGSAGVDGDDGRTVARPRGWGMWLAHAGRAGAWAPVDPLEVGGPPRPCAC